MHHTTKPLSIGIVIWHPTMFSHCLNGSYSLLWPFWFYTPTNTLNLLVIPFRNVLKWKKIANYALMHFLVIILPIQSVADYFVYSWCHNRCFFISRNIQVGDVCTIHDPLQRHLQYQDNVATRTNYRLEYNTFNTFQTFTVYNLFGNQVKRFRSSNNINQLHLYP